MGGGGGPGAGGGLGGGGATPGGGPLGADGSKRGAGGGGGQHEGWGDASAPASPSRKSQNASPTRHAGVAPSAPSLGDAPFVLDPGDVKQLLAELGQPPPPPPQSLSPPCTGGVGGGSASAGRVDTLDIADVIGERGALPAVRTVDLMAPPSALLGIGSGGSRKVLPKGLTPSFSQPARLLYTQHGGITDTSPRRLTAGHKYAVKKLPVKVRPLAHAASSGQYMEMGAQWKPTA